MSAIAEQVRCMRPGDEALVYGSYSMVRYYCRRLIGKGRYETSKLSVGHFWVRFLPERRKPLIVQFAPVLELKPSQFVIVDAARWPAKMIHQLMLTHRPEWKIGTRTLGGGKRAVVRWK